MKPVVTFIRLNKQITLQHNDLHNIYYLSCGQRGNRISESLADYIRATYKPGQIQPSSRYS